MNENEKKDLVAETEDTLTEETVEETVDAVEETAEAIDEEIVEEASEEDVEDAALEAAILENGGKEKKAKKAKAPKAKRKFNTRKLRFGSMATVLTVVVLVALVLISVVADILNDRYPISLDLTADKTYTFSENSEKVAALVDREVNIVVFMDEEYFKNPSYSSEEENIIVKQFYEFTKKYESLTGGKVKTTYINPANDPTAYSKYENYGVTESTSILMYTEDRSRTVALDELFEIESSIDYSTYQYVDTITGSNVENVLAAKLQYLCREEVTNVTILTGHKEQEYTVSGVTEILEANGYEVTQLDFTTVAEIDEDTKMLVIAAPASDFNADEIQRLRTWLNNEDAFGRHMLVMLHQTADCPNLYEFLEEEYYVQVTDNIVAATESSDMFYSFSSSAAYFTYADLEATDYVGDLEGRVIFPFARQLVPLKDNNTDYAERVVPLISFSDTVKLSPIVRDEAATDEEAELVDPDDVVYGALMAVYESYNNDLQQSVSSYVMVCGAQDFLTSGLRDYNSTAVNEAYFLNVVSSLLGHEESIQISTRDMTTETLEFDTVTAIVLGLVVFTVGIPVVMLILCLVVFIRRKNL